MADECCDVSKIATTFLLNTCRLLPRLSQRKIQGASLCAQTAGQHSAYDEEGDYIPLVTGSVAEFYIEPMLPHVGDIDVMFHRNTELAIPRRHRPPTQLPAEFHNYVTVFEIIDSHLPGYVYLELRYLLTQCVDDDEYNAIECDEAHNYTNKIFFEDNALVIHGPAGFADNGDSLYLSVDAVPCVRCLSWPPQAADWPTRHRNYGWPDSATVDRVVGNGCDVVPVAHRQCRQHEWMGMCQHRLSFSRAEIVLINSWRPLQQIVYHMLRYFKKTERLTDCADNSGADTLSNYHIKTLMLWACELKQRSWWTEDLNLVRICVELLHTLSVWLSDTRYPHYFTNNCNLLDNSFNVKNMTSKFVSIDEQYLSTRLMTNYIGQCAQMCPVYISRLFNDVSTTTVLENVVSEIIRWRLSTSHYDMRQAVRFAELVVAVQVPDFPLTARSCVYWMNELAKIDQRFCMYFSAVALLRVAHEVSRTSFSNDLLDILAIIPGSNVNQCCSILSQHKTELNTKELVELLQKSAVEHLTTYRQLMSQEFGSVATIVTTDFEAMYAYKRGDYQRCLQLSTQNVQTLRNAYRMTGVLTYPGFIQMLDDDIVSLTALTLIVNPRCRDNTGGICVSQLTLSLYLMTQCQLKLCYSMMSLAHTLDYVEEAQGIHPREHTLDQLTLKLIERKVYAMISP